MKQGSFGSVILKVEGLNRHLREKIKNNWEILILPGYKISPQP